ncbi:MAG: NAD-dependent epimerase/dehydratase family protein [Sorangiineae bacterium PRO1]|nr:NAD-dependent epimerase/dehydratase family protein [Sorangiineae bacterium PRO1]
MTSVLVTGAAGYIGGLTVRALAARRADLGALVALDVREPPSCERLEGVTYVTGSVCDAGLADLFAEHHIDTVVHLASILKPPREGGEDLAYRVDVEGTRNVLGAAVKCGVKKLVVTTSGAAYGYYPDNPKWLEEHHPVRGNEEIAYSRNKRLIERELERCREEHPELAQLIFRPGTVIGAGVKTPVTELFEAKVLLGVLGSDSPFVFIWDADVVECIVRGVFGSETGIYNLAGDGALSPREIAERLGKPYLPVPAPLIAGALALLKRLGKSAYGPEQVKFLRYRPVLSNRALKERFGYTPKKTSRQAFETYAAALER